MKGTKFTLCGAHVVDASSGLDGNYDILVEDGVIQAVDKPGAFARTEVSHSVDLKGLVISPGLIDVHVHLREPGYEWKETIESGTRSAIAGGYTAVCSMPNTSPANDRASVTEFILGQAAAAKFSRVYPIGAITQGLEGKAMAPMIELRKAGCVAFSDDGMPVWDAGVMRRALEYSLMLDAVLTCHEEEKSLSHGFAMNESALSLRLGLKGMPSAAEDVMIARDIELARLTRARVHFCHVTTARAVLLIRRAKEDGIPVTAEVTPHHFTLNENAVSDYDTNTKMSPPLRSEEDRAAVLQALKDGVIDCIASDHAPHEADSKNKEFQEASFGIVGFQSNLPLTLAQVRAGKLSLSRALASLSSEPARCLRLTPTKIAKGSAADLTVIDLENTLVLERENMLSKSVNSPFMGWKLQGNAVATFVGGECRYRASGFEAKGLPGVK